MVAVALHFSPTRLALGRSALTHLVLRWWAAVVLHSRRVLNQVVCWRHIVRSEVDATLKVVVAATPTAALCSTCGLRIQARHDRGRRVRPRPSRNIGPHRKNVIQVADTPQEAHRRTGRGFCSSS
jgi:hypothetical protein|mmetsp:Transcript_47202/g.139242  ORF Transcript_47202/g.139242 Transcript_47202/m.139242 type:complete len:125 (-) Transcript_47202:141-515(-)